MNTCEPDSTGVTRREFMTSMGAAAGCVALGGVPGIASAARRAATGPLDGAVAAWIRWRPGQTAEIVLGHRPRDSDRFELLATAPAEGASDPASLITTARRLVAEHAARSWGVPAQACRDSPRRVSHPPTGRTVDVCIWLSAHAA